MLHGTVVPSNPTPKGDDSSTFDSLGVHNRFDGPEGGLTAELYFGRFSVSATAKLALGVLHEAARIDGGTVVDSAPFAGGVLAQRTNLGTYSRDRFAVVPEARLDAGFRLTDGLRVYAGYEFLYVSGVVRAGSLLDGVDSRLVPQLHPGGAVDSAVRPAFHWAETGLWAQGLTCGVEVRY